jgi:nitroimidazol reductase NimA-like FMN-containing flavoprotein (pyridoxamine 5'-phosphate oxidase superfamily)
MNMTDSRRIPLQTQKGTAVIPERLKALDAHEHFAVLATDDNGRPYTSLVSYALMPDMKRLVFATSRKTRKYANIVHSANVALLIDNRSQKRNKLLKTEAVTIIGIAKPVRKSGFRDKLVETLLNKHPALEEFIRAPATALFVVDINQCVHVNQFQRVTVWNFPESR